MRSSDDVFNLQQFLTAQQGSYEVALRELRRGAKRSHWIWYVFPQVAGLGTSSMAERYALRSRREAAAYLTHPVLGARLVECATALLEVEGRSAEEVMGSPDDLKLRSSMTLFAAVAGPDSIFQKVLDRYFSGIGDPRTTEFLSAHD